LVILLFVNRTILWLLACALGYFNAEAEPNPTLNDEIIELFAGLLETLKATKEQRQQLLSLTTTYSSNCTQESDSSDKMLDRLKELFSEKNDALDMEIRNLNSILSSTQVAKFLLWVKANPACMQMLDALWPHMTSSTQES
jgi:hypothetical protein